MPMWTYFLNMYYLGGVSDCMRIFVCASACRVATPPLHEDRTSSVRIGVLRVRFTPLYAQCPP